MIRLSAYVRKLRWDGPHLISLRRVVSAILREQRLKKIVVQGNFPLALARELSDLKIKGKAKDGSFFTEREVKTAEEIKKTNALDRRT